MPGIRRPQGTSTLTTYAGYVYLLLAVLLLLLSVAHVLPARLRSWKKKSEIGFSCSTAASPLTSENNALV